MYKNFKSSALFLLTFLGLHSSSLYAKTLKINNKTTKRLGVIITRKGSVIAAYSVKARDKGTVKMINNKEYDLAIGDIIDVGTTAMMFGKNNLDEFRGLRSFSVKKLPYFSTEMKVEEEGTDQYKFTGWSGELASISRTNF